MQNRREYIIQFVGLAIGEHLYEYVITDKFFEDREYSEIQKSNINLKINLLKQSTMMVLHFDISGTVKADCDRCTEEFDLPITGNYKLIVKVGGSLTGDEDDDIITIPANEHELDLSQHIYEYIALSLPIKRVHPDNKKGEPTCNKEMLEKLSSFLTEEEKSEEEEPTDPRWDGLKNITLN
ncbi:MAG: DUF177 domain-containing protein [Bacteroidia bacterium]|jgi:uncharacterized metal-binding protein YceD (DUF177 family)